MKFLDITGLQTFVENLRNVFATKDTMSQYKAETDWYLLDIDYSLLEFNKNEIVK